MTQRPALPTGPWLVVGLGKSGLAAGRALVAAGHAVIGVDSGHPDVGDPGFEVTLGTDGLEALAGAAAVVKSPGVGPATAVVAAARAARVPVLGELELGWRMTPNPVVAVTGTNGKTTVSEWIGHALRAAGRPVVVVGNVGTPYTSMGPQDAHATAVVECSSYQLADSLAFRPEVGILLNLGSDHLDWHGTEDAYRQAKLDGMFSRQVAGDVAVLPRDIHAGGAASRVILDDVGLPAEPSLPGAHNHANAQAVVAACRELGLAEDAIAGALQTFGGVAHRLEDLGVHDGIRYINDSKATNVASTLTALVAMVAPVHLIAGGDDSKNEDFGPLRAAVAEYCSSVQLIGAAALRMRSALGTGEDRSDLDAAVAAARAVALPGDVILLSPACASFDQYADYEARGAHFKELASGRRKPV